MAAPITPQEIPYRAELRQDNGPFRPSTFGNIFSFGTFTLLKTNSPVLEARRLHLLCVVGVVKPSIPRSRIIPRTFPSSPFAQTTAMSATGEFVIHILAPFKR
ncbi:hypothetical protein D3C86_1400180 [compost metagenome]